MNDDWKKKFRRKKQDGVSFVWLEDIEAFIEQLLKEQAEEIIEELEKNSGPCRRLANHFRARYLPTDNS